MQETITSLGAPILLRTLKPGGASQPRAALARWRHGDAVVDIAPSDTVRLAVSLQDGQNVSTRVGAASKVAGVRVGSVSVFAAAERSQVAVEGEADILQLFVLESALHSMSDNAFECPVLFDRHDQELQTIAMRLLVAAVRNDLDDTLLLDMILHDLACVLRRYAEASSRDAVDNRRAVGGLSPSALRRVHDLTIDALDVSTVASPTLKQLAEAANLSVSHFIRAFRQETGETPHRHVLRRRIERAVTLLKKPGQTVAEVSDETGFATPAHFVATFHRFLGVTPGAVREALLA